DAAAGPGELEDHRHGAAQLEHRAAVRIDRRQHAGPGVGHTHRERAGRDVAGGVGRGGGDRGVARGEEGAGQVVVGDGRAAAVVGGRERRGADEGADPRGRAGGDGGGAGGRAVAEGGLLLVNDRDRLRGR